MPLPILQPQKRKFQESKNKKNSGDIIILHNCTKNLGHKLYYFWGMAPDQCNCHISFWVMFRFGLLPSNSSNNKNFKTMKIMHRDIIISHNSAKNHNPMCLTSLGYTVSGIWHVTHVIVLFFFQFGLFFAFPHLHTPLTDQKIKAFQKIKQLLEALSF